MLRGANSSLWERSFLPVNPESLGVTSASLGPMSLKYKIPWRLRRTHNPIVKVGEGGNRQYREANLVQKK